MSLKRSGRVLATFLCLGWFGCASSSAAKRPAAARPSSGSATSVLPALYAPLFQAGARAEFHWQFEVDTHDEEGTVASFEASLVCTAEALERWSEVHAVEWTCQSDAPEEWSGLSNPLDGVWLGAPEGLWRLSSVPGSEAEARREMRSPPFLPGSPVELSNTFEDDGGGDPMGTDTLTVTVTRLAPGGEAGWCRVDARDTTVGYSSSSELCFKEGVGVVSGDFVGRNGPSQEKVRRR